MTISTDHRDDYRQTDRHTVVHSQQLDWVPLAPGLSFKPLAFFPDDSGYQLLLRVEPGTVVPRHRHTGTVHAFMLSGRRRIAGVADEIGPGCYVHEPAGNVDSWWAVGEAGDEPCVAHLEVRGRIEYLGTDDEVVRFTDASTARAAYVAWCRERGVAPLASLTSPVEG